MEAKKLREYIDEVERRGGLGDVPIGPTNQIPNNPDNWLDWARKKGMIRLWGARMR